MDMIYYRELAGVVLLALTFGSMAFFAFVFTPLVFTQLPPERSGPFIRIAFPVYARVMGALTFLSAAALWGTPESWALAGVFVFFLFGLIVLMPRINRYRDAQLAGDKSAEKPFNRLHRASVWINNIQLIVVTLVFIRLVSQ